MYNTKNIQIKQKDEHQDELKFVNVHKLASGWTMFANWTVQYTAVISKCCSINDVKV